MSLKTIVEEIKKNTKYANEKIGESNNFATIQGRIGRKRTAKLKLDGLARDYAKEVTPKLMFVVAYGAGAKTFANSAQQIAQMDQIDGQSFYLDLISRVDPSYYSGKQSSRAVLEVLGRHLEEIVSTLGVASYPQLVYKNKYDEKIKNKKDLLKFAQKIINTDIGPEMSALYLTAMAAKKALDESFTDSFYPIVLSLEDESSAKDIVGGLQKLTSRVYPVAADVQTPSNLIKGSHKVESNEEESVTAVLKKIRSSIKNK